MKLMLTLVLLTAGVGGVKAQGETDITTLPWVQKAQGCTQDFNNVNGGTVYGTDAGGTNISYVDVSAYGTIKLYGTAGQTARLFINREETGDVTDKYTFSVTLDVNGVATFDCNTVLTKQPLAQYIHLNGVKAQSWNTTLNLSKITVSGSAITFPEPDPFILPDGEVEINTLPWVNQGQGCANNLGIETDAPIYGTDAGPNNGNLSYIDATDYSAVKLYGPDGTVRLFINRAEYASGTYQFYVTIKDGVGTLNMADVYTAQEGATYIHINGVKASTPGAKAQVNHITLVEKPFLAQRKALREKIAEASRYSNTFYSAASYEALQDAIAAAEAAILATNSTAESLTAAEEALDAAVSGLQIAEGYRELVAEDFFQWDAVRNPTSRTSLDWHQAVVGTSTGQPFGDSSVDKLNYANLRQYDKLIVTVSAGTPRFLFNRDVDEGQWNADETQSHLIDNTKGDANSWHSKYFSNEGNTYIVDLKQMLTDKGIVNLNAIKGANYGNVTVTGMYLYRESDPDTYGIIGPLVGGWEVEDKEMTEGLMGMYSYTFTDEFHATQSAYEYKLRANKTWDNSYQLPASGNKTWTPEEVGGYYNLTIKADVLTNSLDVEAVPVTETHTATFTTNNLDWEEVYAFVWTEGQKNFLGEWPGTKLEATDGVYTVNFESVKGTVAPEKIIFNNGKDDPDKEQTGDLDWEDGYAYVCDLNYFVMSENLFGNWEASDAQMMTKNNDGTYTLNLEGKVLSANQEYKVMKDLGGKTSWYPDGDNRVIGISMAGTYDIAISFNPADNSITEAMSIYKNISGAGYATYCSPYALNFDGTGVQAYIAKVEGNEVKFYEVTNAPANTGLLLKAPEGTYKVKMETITGEGATDATGNALIGVLSETTINKKGIFVLMNDPEIGVGFYKTSAESFTVGANTAYIDAISGARSFIALDGEATAIEGIAAEKNLNGEIFNLQGQRVMKAQKGLYIINGKKVVVK
ncbi:MAG: starch-binding protein [Prevotella sp.]|nr:starch-binding protein [Prevotella sp.]